MRSYWIERPLQALIITIPVTFIVGIDGNAVIMLPLASTLWLLFAHSNLRLRMGWLSPVICGPQVHRIHHSNHQMHQGKNFAQYFPVIDVIFGTYYQPKPDEFPPTGLIRPQPDASIVQMIKKPFIVWWRLLKTSARKTTS